MMPKSGAVEWKYLYYALFGGVLVLTGYFLYDGYRSSNKVISVAFIGNSFTFVNDLPRVMEAMSEGKLRQDSLLHGSLNFKSFLKKGNGMYNQWGNKTNAFNEEGYPDLGACTVIQLLQGYDKKLENFRNYYYDDGRNPCFMDYSYLEYSIISRDPNNQPEENVNDDRSSLVWDYVVLNDQSMRPTDFNSKRSISGSVLESIYAPLLQQSKSIPVLYATWGYWREDIDMSPFVDIPTFTSRLYEGYLYYAQILEEALPESQAPRIAPVGLAYLTIWEENPSFWEKLFGEDQYHPSPHGTYLAGCVIYSTIHNHLPPSSSRYTTPLFSRSRSMQITGGDRLLPTEEDALYLRWIAKRVALHGYIPKSLNIVSN